MDTIAGVSVAEYLHEVYEPDRDYVDGEAQERNMGEKEHSAWQTAIAAVLRAHRAEWGIRVYVELRVRIASDRYRVPDITIVRRDAPDEQIITHPPIACIEILSPEDRFGRVEQKIEDYAGLGVKNVWIVDLIVQQGYRCDGANQRDWVKTNQFIVEGSPIVLDLPEIAKDLD